MIAKEHFRRVMHIQSVVWREHALHPVPNALDHRREPDAKAMFPPPPRGDHSTRQSDFFAGSPMADIGAEQPARSGQRESLAGHDYRDGKGR